MNKFLSLFFLLFCFNANAKQLKVMVIDTGYDFKSKWAFYSGPKAKLCNNGHKDFTGAGLIDNDGHGTHIANLIGRIADDSNYCIMIAKFYDAKNIFSANNTVKAFKYAIEQNVDIINYSAGGSQPIQEECDVVKKALNRGIIIVAAAGNNSSNLVTEKFFPAMCDDRVLKISNVDSAKRTIASTSNYSDETISVRGTNVISLTPNDSIAQKSGTSQAAAIYTGKLIKTLQILNNRRGE